MIEFGPYTWNGYEQRKRKRWLKDFVLVYAKCVTTLGRK